MEDGRPFLIGGRWSHTATTAPVRNPYTGETIAHVCQAGLAEADAAVQSSVEGAVAMRRLSGYARSTLLQKAAQALQARQEEFARTMMAEAGKPLTDARREVGRAIQTFSIAGGRSQAHRG